MTFSLAKATAWVTGDLITAARIQTIDTNQSRAVDGYAGGPYNPSSLIAFTGTNGVSLGSSGNVIPSGGSLTVQTGGGVSFADPGQLISTSYIAYRFVGAPEFDPTYWTHQMLGGITGYGWVQTSVASAYRIQFPIINVPLTATVTGVVARVKGATSHGGTLPDTMPNLEIGYKAATDGAWTSVDNEDDPSADTTAYEATHYIQLTGLSYSMSSNNPVLVRLTGETGGTAITGFGVLWIKVSFTNTVFDNR